MDRRTVFRIASQADTAEGRRHLLVAALVWGTGTKAQSVNRRARIFEHSSPADIDARLDEALNVLRERGAADGYWAFNNDQRIPHLGLLLSSPRCSTSPGTTTAQAQLSTDQSSWTASFHEPSRPRTLRTPTGRRTAGRRTNIGSTWAECTSTRRPEEFSRIKSRQLCSQTASSSLIESRTAA